MYIFRDLFNHIVKIIDNPCWVVWDTNNECFRLCSYEEAEGVSIDGKQYHIMGRSFLFGIKDDIFCEKIDSGKMDFKLYNSLREMFLCLSETGALKDSLIVKNKDFFPVWEKDYNYKKGQIVMNETDYKLYRCTQDHVSNVLYPPDKDAIWGIIPGQEVEDGSN